MRLKYLDRRLLIGFVLSVVLTVALACGAADDEPTVAPAQPAAATAQPAAATAQPAATTAPAPVAQVQPAATAAPAAESVKKGGRLVIGKISDVCGLDVFGAGGGCEATWKITTMVYESLLYIDEDLNVVPLLAESWKTSDNKTYVFKLREGLQFHRKNNKGTKFSTAREISANDVVFSLNRSVDPELGGFWGRKLFSLDPEFKEIGPYEFSITVAEPNALVLPLIGHMNHAIVPGAEVAAGTINMEEEMLGAGPFEVAEWVKDARWRLDKFDDYWQPKLTGRDVPVLDGVNLPIIPDDATRLAALRVGEIHLSYFENPKMLDLAGGDANLGIRDQPTTNYYRIDVQADNPDTKNPALADVRVRQALMHATDRAEIAQIAAFGYAKPTAMVSALRGEFAVPLEELPGYTYDVEKAKKLLADAGYSNGADVGKMMVTPYIPLTVTIGQLLKQQWAKAGIETEIVVQEQSVWIDGLFAGEYDTLVSWSAGYTDPVLNLLGYDEQSLKTRYGLVEPEFHELMSAMANEVDPSRRVQRVHEAERKYADLAFHLPVITKDTLLAWRKDIVGGLKFEKVDGFGVPLWKGIQEVFLLK